MFMFLDEAGKPDPQDGSPFFIVGGVYAAGADHIAKEFGKVRQSHHCRREFHFREAGAVNRNVLAGWLKIWHKCNGQAVIVIAQKNDINLIEQHGCAYQAQVALIDHALRAAHRQINKPIIAMMDDFESRTGFNLENQIKTLAPPHICVGALRLRSHSNDLIQFADLLTSSIYFYASKKEQISVDANRNSRFRAKREIARMIGRSFGFDSKLSSTPSLQVVYI